MLAVATSSCTTPQSSADQTITCSSEWFSLVDQKVQVTDSQGHGPELGSAEWRSAVEFKLGIDEHSKAPPIATEKWCTYINRDYIAG